LKLIYRDWLKIFRKSTFTVFFTDALYLIPIPGDNNFGESLEAYQQKIRTMSCMGH
jgi:hypothetical protein